MVSKIFWPRFFWLIILFTTNFFWQEFPMRSRLETSQAEHINGCFSILWGSWVFIHPVAQKTSSKVRVGTVRFVRFSPELLVLGKVYKTTLWRRGAEFGKIYSISIFHYYFTRNLLENNNAKIGKTKILQWNEHLLIHCARVVGSTNKIKNLTDLHIHLQNSYLKDF